MEKTVVTKLDQVAEPRKARRPLLDARQQPLNENSHRAVVGVMFSDIHKLVGDQQFHELSAPDLEAFVVSCLNHQVDPDLAVRDILRSFVTAAGNPDTIEAAFDILAKLKGLIIPAVAAQAGMAHA